MLLEGKQQEQSLIRPQVVYTFLFSKWLTVHLSVAFKQCLCGFNWINCNTKYSKIKKIYF